MRAGRLNLASLQVQILSEFGCKSEHFRAVRGKSHLRCAIAGDDVPSFFSDSEGESKSE